jgi:anti-sigma B factor antagonist
MPSTEQRATSRIAIEGPMTIYEAVQHKRELLAALAAGSGIEIDLSGVDEMDSAGLQLLVLARREASKAGKTAFLMSPSAATQEVLDRYGLGPDLRRVPPRG